MEIIQWVGKVGKEERKDGNTTWFICVLNTSSRLFWMVK
jgi:hypothetical protein